MHAATLLGRSFSVVTTLARTIGRPRTSSQRYGFAGRCRGVHACDIPVLELDDPARDARKSSPTTCRRAVEPTAPTSIVLGCAGMADLCDRRCRARSASRSSTASAAAVSSSSRSSRSACAPAPAASTPHPCRRRTGSRTGRAQHLDQRRPARLGSRHDGSRPRRRRPRSPAQPGTRTVRRPRCGASPGCCAPTAPRWSWSRSSWSRPRCSIVPFLTQAVFDKALFPPDGEPDLHLLGWLVARHVRHPDRRPR